MTKFIGIQTITAGQDTVQSNLPMDGVKGYLVGNESGLTEVIIMDGQGDSKSLYPGTVDYFPVRKGFSGTIIAKNQSLLNNVALWPSSFLQYDMVGIGDTSFNASVYPLTLPRLTNIGNSVPLTTSTSQLINNGSAPLSNIITVQPSDVATPTWLADNSGNFTVKGDNAGTLTTLLQLIAGASPTVKLAAASILVEVLGGLQIDGSITFPNGNQQTITWNGGGFLSNIQGGNDGSITYNSSGTSHKFLGASNNLLMAVNSSGITLDGTNQGLIFSTSIGGFLSSVTGNSDGTVSYNSSGSTHKFLTIGNAETARITATGLQFQSGKQVIFGSGHEITDVFGITGTGSGTFVTGAPNNNLFIAFDPCTVSGSSQTIGGTRAASTVVTTASGLAWSATIITF